MSRDRLLVIDADVSKRLTGWLSHRARRAISLAELGLAHNVPDGDVLRALADRYNGNEDWILVTGDDKMPAEHGRVIHDTAATLATINPDYPRAEMTEHNWRIDVVQRWAHRMQLQEPQSVRRYAFNGSEVWRPRRRHLRDIALHGWTAWEPDGATAGQDGQGATASVPVIQEPITGFPGSRKAQAPRP